VKRNYVKFLLPYECKFDLGDIDPAPIIAAMEAAVKKDSRRHGKSQPESTEQSGEWTIG